MHQRNRVMRKVCVASGLNNWINIFTILRIKAVIFMNGALVINIIYMYGHLF